MTFKFNFGGEVDETVEDEQQQDNGQDYMPLTEILIGKQVGWLTTEDPP